MFLAEFAEGVAEVSFEAGDVAPAFDVFFAFFSFEAGEFLFYLEADAFHLGVEAEAPALEFEEAGAEGGALVVDVAEVVVFEGFAFVEAGEDVFDAAGGEGFLCGEEGVDGVSDRQGGDVVGEGFEDIIARGRDIAVAGGGGKKMRNDGKDCRVWMNRMTTKLKDFVGRWGFRGRLCC